MSKRTELLAIANQYGNVDSVPKGYSHVSGERLQPLCRKLGIKYAQHMVGWGGSRNYPKPIFDGVVVSSRSADNLRQEIEARNVRTSASRKRATKKRAERLAQILDIGVMPGSHTDRALRSGRIDADEARFVGFRNAYRHEHTDYDSIIGDLGKELAREVMQARQSPPSTWDEYLARYDLADDATAVALSQVLKDPSAAHPVWFMEAVIAAKRTELPLGSLTYDKVRDAITSWRIDRQLNREARRYE